MTPNAVQYLFKEVLSTNNLLDIRFHDLRHTNATLMLRNEVPAKIMTDMQQGAVSAIENMLKE